jgi:hypothetical protein
MYMLHLGVYRRSLALEAGGYRPTFDGSQDYDFALRATERASRIVHVPGVLYRWRVHEHSAALNEIAKPYAYSAARRALQEHLERTGVPGEVHFGAFPGLYRMVHRVPPNAAVAVILPLTCEADALAAATTRVLDAGPGGDCRALELVLVGAPAVLSVYAARLQPDDPAAHVVKVEAAPGCSVATLMNIGASAADADYLVLLDEPVESLTRDWLARLIGFAAQAGVGAAGARTLATNGRVEQAGIVLPDGIPLPVLHGANSAEWGGVGIGRLVCNLSAVSGVVATRQDTFCEAGGIDDQVGVLGVIDFCLRVGEKGMRIVSVPDVIFRHIRQAPTVNDLPALHAFRMRWRNRLGRDPFFNPSYYADRADFRVRPGI